MAVKKGGLGKGLGKGLDSLISDKVNTKQLNTGVKPEVKQVEVPVPAAETMVKISKVEPNKEQPRKVFDEKALNELADSIKQHGIISPLLVQKKDGYYEIVAGERRWRAAKIAGLKEVPVVVKEFTEQERMEVALIENIQREDLNPLEEAIAYRTLIDEFHLKQDDLAKRVSKSRSAITNSMRLLKLSQAVQDLVAKGKLSMGHARCLIPIEDEELQLKAAKQIIDEVLSVRDAEKLVKKLLVAPKAKRVKAVDEQQAIIYKSLSEELKQILGTKVEIKQKNKKAGKIEIEYYSADELERIFDLIRNHQ